MPSGPTKERDESVQFSLKELLKLEDQRLEEQARERDARDAAAVRVREETERRRHAEAEAKARAEEETRERQRRTELEELARREAMQKAIVEQARLEVEARTRAEERERERRHEIEIERLRSTSKKGSSLGALIAASALGGGVMLVVALGIHLGVHQPTSERRIVELQQSVAAAEGRSVDLARRLDEQTRIASDRERQLADVQDQLRSLANTPPPPTAGKLGLTAGSKGPSPKPRGGEKDKEKDKETTCLPGDPMCFSLKTGR
jgi:colicin import membrane protein